MTPESARAELRELAAQLVLEARRAQILADTVRAALFSSALDRFLVECRVFLEATE